MADGPAQHPASLETPVRAPRAAVPRLGLVLVLAAALVPAALLAVFSFEDARSLAWREGSNAASTLARAASGRLTAELSAAQAAMRPRL